MRIVIKGLNRKNIPVSSLDGKLLTFYLNQKLQLFNSRKNFDKQLSFCLDLKEIINNESFSLKKIDDGLYIKKGIYFDQTNEILNCFGIKGLSQNKKNGFDKLKKHRTAIVHEFIGASVPDNEFEECKNLIVDTIYDIANKYITFLENYPKHPYI